MVGRASAPQRQPKPGRNDPCHRGSGLKYKKCCLESDEETLQEPARDPHGRLIGREPIQTQWEAQGKLVRAVGNAIVITDPHETAHEFFLGTVQREFGARWHAEQMKLAEGDRHPVATWWEVWADLRAGRLQGFEATQEGEHLYGAQMPGEVKALLCLGYELYTLAHSGVLSAALIRRLLRSDQFQGARYEAAIAAVFVRAGYEIQWINEADRKLPEFIARHGKAEIAVEVKSRHRHGVLGRPGEPPALQSLEIDVEHLPGRALEKETDGRPFVVCIDLNLPPAQTSSVEEWAAQLQDNVIKRHGFESTGEPDRFSAVIFTNYSWHWDELAPPGNPINVAVRARTAEIPVPWKRLNPVIEAIFQYGDVSNLDVELAGARDR